MVYFAKKEDSPAVGQIEGATRETSVTALLNQSITCNQAVDNRKIIGPY
jgi:hypothetical protein